MPAVRSGGPNSPTLADGWYFLLGDEPDPRPDSGGPFRSTAEAGRRHAVALLSRVPGLRLLGHTFMPMNPDTRQGFLGAPEDAMVAYGVDGTLLIWDPEERTISEIVPEGLHITTEVEEERAWTFRVVR